MLGCSLLGSIIIYRCLAAGSSDMAAAGQFAISMAIVRILANSVGSAADLVVLRRVPTLFRSDLEAAMDVVRAAFLLRVATLFMALAPALLLQSWLAERFLDGRDHAPLVLLIAVAGAGELLLRSVLAYFQATERFDRFVAFESVFQGGRLLVILALASMQSLSVTTVLVSYGAMGCFAAVLGARRLPPGLLAFRPIPAPVLGDTARFFVWTLLGFSLAAGTERMDLFLLGRFRGAQDVGLYGGVLTLAVIPDFVSGLLATVLQPRVMRLQERGELLIFSRKLMLVMLPFCVLALVVVVSVGDAIVALALGPRFSSGVPALIVLAAGSLAWLVLTPVPAVLISMTAPRTSLTLIVLQLLMVVGGGVVLIPTYGVVGAAAAVAGTRVVIAVAVVVVGERMMRWPAVAGRSSTS
jgi:O-antigen/teichoic acid export membrane protein